MCSQLVQLSQLELAEETTFRQLGRSSEIDVTEARRSCCVEREPSEDAAVVSLARSLVSKYSTSEAIGLSGRLG